ncbi:pyridoxamine 5'-phosphate oxidase family protein [Sulfitobacter donghicola]|uniref:Oxidoreductase n=1 Tax=Sulfitobacter donghicola DSW-25 = KCTC 12864 = JCM 14565 TaxID=1300350 RepID=A0A073IEW2_9RHOB|nr:pyridoxamine 5'-phosphate oxidase family protein [Sulfitobacter donghicola]KEJ88309.1 oxidoreductase [Sulfitobacter donghicola DSW-25 = KCTC 12864 = JCM 14565]KIN68905.1 Oxidoreductase FAD/NAD(P)-binding [Sulfitobacter donghicola DSW-25 = KCTC 12864 = JCM 14565]
MAQIHKSHKGELRLQERRNTPKEMITSIPQYIAPDMPQQHADFFADLPYLPLATLDHDGRPWVSLLVTHSKSDPSAGIKISDQNTMSVVAESNPYDPFARALMQGPTSDHAQKLFAGVGVDFSNRRRNKIAGEIRAASVEESGKISLLLASDQHLGNCPKYITLRELAYEKRSADLVYDSFETHTAALPNAAKAIVDQASTVFLATKHSADEASSGIKTDMGVNHRGGAPGFTRLYEETNGDEITTYLVLPDHSGNRFYQSLGNIETDPEVGLAFPDFRTGHVLYITGEAENLLDDEAEALMPRSNLLTRIKVTGAVFVKNALNLRLTSDEQVSLYNPPVKYLRRELEQTGHVFVPPEAASPISATLVSTHRLSDSIRTFNFDLSQPIKTPLPGGYGVFDFSGLMDAGYRHMSEAYPQLVNEDYLRSWTLSNAPAYDADSNEFAATNQLSVTVKRKTGGLMSNVLHNNAHKLVQLKLPVEFKGTGASFTCFTPGTKGALPSVPSKMLWIAGGVGITPFMAMWDGILEMARAHPQTSTDIVLLFSGRGDDIRVLEHFARQIGAVPASVKLRIVAFQSAKDDLMVAKSARNDLRSAFSEDMMQIEERRVQVEDIECISAVDSREVYMCGPNGFMTWGEAALTELGVEESRLHREAFTF